MQRAIAQLKRLETESGGFGTFLHMAHNWADWTQTIRSYELFARYVMPEFQGRNANRNESYAWAAKHHEAFMGKVGQAITKEIEKDSKERGAPTDQSGEGS